MKNTLTWSSDLQEGSVWQGGERYALNIKPQLSFSYENVYFEPDLERFLKNTNIPLTESEQLEVSTWIDEYTPPIVEEPLQETIDPTTETKKLAQGLLYASKDLYPTLSSDEQSTLLQRRLDLKAFADPVVPELEAKVKEWFLSSMTMEEILEAYKVYREQV